MFKLVPAVIYKSEIEKKIAEKFYTDDMMYMCGCNANWIPQIDECPDESLFQYAIIERSTCKLVGYLAYRIDWYSSCAHQFGLFAFESGKGITKHVFAQVIDDLIHKRHLHRIEWRMVGGNFIESRYDYILKKYNGTKHELRDYFKDKDGKYHNDYIYEIITEQGE